MKQLIVLFMLGIAMRGWAQTGACDAILQFGIWETDQSVSEEDQTNEVLDWLSQSSFHSWSEAKTAGVKIGVPVDGIPIELNGANAESNWRAYQSQLQSLKQSTSTYRGKFLNLRKTASSKIAQTWLGCMNSNGLHVRPLFTANPLNILAEVVFRSDGAPFTRKLGKVEVLGSDTTTCKNDDLNKDLGSAVIYCLRRDASTPVDLVIHNEYKDLPLSISGLAKPATMSIGNHNQRICNLSIALSDVPHSQYKEVVCSNMPPGATVEARFTGQVGLTDPGVNIPNALVHLQLIQTGASECYNKGTKGPTGCWDTQDEGTPTWKYWSLKATGSVGVDGKSAWQLWVVRCSANVGDGHCSTIGEATLDIRVIDQQ